jgi:hypothetical protein
MPDLDWIEAVEFELLDHRPDIPFTEFMLQPEAHQREIVLRYRQIQRVLDLLKTLRAERREAARGKLGTMTDE